ncbi:MAG: hypothetical protein AAGC55_14835 [Myxococcota bacterium]
MTRIEPPFAVERLRFADDVDWLPPGERARVRAPSISLRLLVRGSWLMATVISVLAVGLIPPSRRRRGQQSELHRRMVRSAVHRWLGRTAVRVTALADLDDLADGTLVRARGWVRPRDHSRAVPFEQLAVDLELGGDTHSRRYSLIRERAVDFELVDRHGLSIVIQTDGSRLVGPAIATRSRSPDLLHRLGSLPWPPPLDGPWPPLRDLAMGCFRLSDGDEVDIYGALDRIVDRAMDHRLPRQDPVRPALRGSQRSPLIILTRR